MLWFVFNSRCSQQAVIKTIIKPYARKRKEADLDGKFECASIFKVNKMPFLEKDINNLIKKMNIDEETKFNYQRLYFSKYKS